VTVQPAEREFLAARDEHDHDKRERLGLEIENLKQRRYTRRVVLDLIVVAIVGVPVFGFYFKEVFLPFYQADNARLALDLAARTRELTAQTAQFEAYKAEAQKALDSQKAANINQLLQIQQENERLKIAQAKAEDEAVALRDQFRDLEARYASLVSRVSPSYSDTQAYKASAKEARERAESLSSRIDNLRQDKKETTERQGMISAELLSNRVSVSVQAVPVERSRSSHGDPNHNFSLSLDVPSEYKDEIQRVEYYFDHPTFQQQTYTSSNPSTNFKITYFGWGCLYQVDATIILKGGRHVRIPFDMCRALGWDIYSG
jgi:hypothetical protein